jgi:hypothetical protein
MLSMAFNPNEASTVGLSMREIQCSGEGQGNGNTNGNGNGNGNVNGWAERDRSNEGHTAEEMVAIMYHKNIIKKEQRIKEDKERVQKEEKEKKDKNEKSGNKMIAGNLNQSSSESSYLNSNISGNGKVENGIKKENDKEGDKNASSSSNTNANNNVKAKEQAKAKAKDLKGIDEEEVMRILGEGKFKVGSASADTREISMSLMDCGGQNEFASMNQFFMTKNALYIVIFNMDLVRKDVVDEKRKSHELRELKMLLNAIVVMTQLRENDDIDYDPDYDYDNDDEEDNEDKDQNQSSSVAGSGLGSPAPGLTPGLGSPAPGLSSGLGSPAPPGRGGPTGRSAGRLGNGHRRVGQGVVLSMAPVLLVGTHKDKVSDGKDHEYISSLLENEVLRDHPSLGYIQRYKYKYKYGKESQSPSQSQSQSQSQSPSVLLFHPVDNSVGRKGDPTFTHLMSTIQDLAAKSSYVTGEKPISWLKFTDELHLAKQADPSLFHMDYESVWSLASTKCGVKSHAELRHMLRYLHSSGRVMWHEDPELIGRVIIKPIHFVEQATRIIRKHRKDSAASPYDTTEHTLALSEDVQQLLDTKYRREWRDMVDSGEAARDLLYLLLTAWDARDIKYIQNRMNINNSSNNSNNR